MGFPVGKLHWEGYPYIWERTGGGQKIVAYQCYFHDEAGGEHPIGILPERITKESILNWVWEVIGYNSSLNSFYFVQVET